MQPDTTFVSQLAVPTVKRLTDLLIEADAPHGMIWAARVGFYHDFLSPLAFPCMALVQDLQKAGLQVLAGRAMEGEFDATKEEADVWAVSPDGQAAIAELGFGPNAAQS